MDKAAIRQAIIERYGPWSAHNIDLGDGVFTVGPQDGPEHTVMRAELALAMVQLFTRKTARDLRALDIGCLEGGISIALGRRGVNVVGLEIRDEHLAKAAFARDALGLKNVAFVKGDMLRLDPAQIGKFDLIVCAGTLYHVDAPQLLPFLRTLNELCSGVTVFDTHVAREAIESFDVEGLRVHGRSIVEHTAGSTEAQKEARGWTARNSEFAFWMTEHGLVNLLTKAGFSSVLKPMSPTVEWPWKDRDFWVATASSLLSWGAQLPSTRIDPDERPDHHPMLDEPMHAVPNPHTQRRPG